MRFSLLPRLVILAYLLGGGLNGFALAQTSTQPAPLAQLAVSVLKNEEGGEPMSGIQVFVSGANQQATLDDRSILFVWSNKQPGVEVEITVRKPGWTTVNFLERKFTLRRDPKQNRVTLFLSKEGEVEKWRRRYYELKTFSAIEEHYEREIAKLTAQNQADAATIADLQEERDLARGAAEKLAEVLAQIAPDQMSELYQRALALFLQGEVEEALDVLDQETLREAVAAARQNGANADRDLENAVESYLLRAQILTTQFRFEEAQQNYQEAIDAAPESFNAHLSYGVFCQRLNWFEIALTAHENALDIARRTGNLPDLAITLNNLGVLHSDRNRPEEARMAYDQALFIRRNLAATNPDAYLPDLAITLSNLGVLHHQNRPEEARIAYDQALLIRRNLATTNPDAYLPDLASTLDYLGILHSDQNRPEEARRAFDQALLIRRDLATTNPDAYLTDVAKGLNNLGNLHLDQNRKEEARMAYDEALLIYRELAGTNPDAYLPYVATTLNNLGVLLAVQGQIGDALVLAQEALTIYVECATKNPEVCAPKVGSTLEFISLLRTLE